MIQEQKSEKSDLEKRRKESQELRERHPKKVPVIIRPAKGCSLVISKKKFLVPHDVPLRNFMYVVRAHMPTLKPEQALFVYADNTIPAMGQLMGEIYRDYQHTTKEADGFLYLQYNLENTFG